MKRIGLTQRVDNFKDYNEQRDSIDRRWYDFFESINCVPFMFPNINEKYFDEYINDVALDGLILSGGNTLASYDHRKNSSSIERDLFEMKLMRYMLKKNLPIIGVCRGMHLVHTYFGGSLIKVIDHIGTVHPIIPKSDNLSLPKTVNSYHSWGIAPENLPKGFSVLATDNLGNIEAYVNKELKVLGIMWHPERETPFKLNDLELFERFFR